MLKLVQQAADGKCVVSERRIEGYGGIEGIHAVRPGFAGAMDRRGPVHDREIAEVPLNVVEARSRKQGVEA